MSSTSAEPMPEESNTPTNDNASGSDADSSKSPDHWEEVGRRLLRSELERVAYSSVVEAFRSAGSRIAAGEELTEEDINALREAAEDASEVAEMAAEASPEAASRPDVWSYLDEEGRREYVEAVEQREREETETEE